MLARVAAAMPALLKVVKHRSAEAQQDLTVIPAADRWRGATDLADIRADAGRPQGIPQEPANRQLSGTADQTAGFGGIATAVADQERGGQVLVQSADSGSAVPIGKIRTGHGSETVGAEAGGARE